GRGVTGILNLRCPPPATPPPARSPTIGQTVGRCTAFRAPRERQASATLYKGRWRGESSGSRSGVCEPFGSSGAARPECLAMTRGNQRELARQKNLKKTQEIHKGKRKEDSLSASQRKQRDSEIMQQKQKAANERKSLQAGAK
uniref:Small EDRK-rich factor-like N-terminal domain-containing protein n=1 Tax=Amazona collaria TaxID=241587 RepID=A0A8B9GD21_9PSIT